MIILEGAILFKQLLLFLELDQLAVVCLGLLDCRRESLCPALHPAHGNKCLEDVFLHLTGRPETLLSYVKDRPGHDRRYALDSSKIQRELGWKPQVSFEDGIRRTIDWYQTNTQWLDNARSGEAELSPERKVI